jgi:hypothetical protein
MPSISVSPRFVECPPLAACHFGDFGGASMTAAGEIGHRISM